MDSEGSGKKNLERGSSTIKYLNPEIHNDHESISEGGNGASDGSTEECSNPERVGDQNSDSRGRLKRGCWAGKNRRGRPRDSSSTTPMYLFARKKSGAVELLGPSTAQLSHQNYQKRKRTPPTPPARTASPPPTRRPQFPRERPSHLAEDHTRGRPRARRPGTSRSTPCARRRRGRDPEL